jgi:DNA-binding transcriptional LysR family regulator
MPVMQPVNVQRLDLNLLKVFDALFEARRVTRAAERLNLSQPALSHALARLREALGDELFTRTPGGMRPTPYALAIAPRLRAALAQIDSALASRGFDPATSTRTFTVGANDYVQLVLLPGLIARLNQVAPQVRLVARAFGDELPLKALAQGELDVAIGLFNSVPSPLVAQTLFSDRFVCIGRRAHPAWRGGGLTLERFAAARHLLISPQGGGFHGPVDEALSGLGLSRRVCYSIQQFLLAPLVVARTDMLATTAQRVARLIAPMLQLRVAELPLALAPFEVKQLTMSRELDDPGVQWLRGEILRQASRSRR